MVKCIAWLFWTYLTLKLIQLVFGSRPGVDEAPVSIRRRLLRGEPILCAIAFALSVPAALLSSWYLHRGYERSLDFAADCYGRLRALDGLPDVRQRFDPFKVDEVIQRAEGSAAIAGQALDLEPARIHGMFAQKSRFHADRYAVLARQGGQHGRDGEAAAIARCLQQPLLNL
jgi:hypothetical protein